MLKQYLQQIKKEIVAVVFPQICAGCNTEMYDNTILCTQCYRQLPYTNMQNQKDNMVEKLLWGRFHFEKAYAMWYMYKESIVSRILYELKYQKRQELGGWIAELMAEQLRQCVWIHDIDIIIPIPLNKKKEKQRGYNQSALIAQALAEQLNKECMTHAIIRTTNTASQTKKSRLQRVLNMNSAFEIANKEELKYKHILLVDDVITTGATIEACALAIQSIESTSISVVGAAIAFNS